MHLDNTCSVLCLRHTVVSLIMFLSLHVVTQIVDVGLDALIRKNLAQITGTQVVFEAARLSLIVVWTRGLFSIVQARAAFSSLVCFA